MSHLKKDEEGYAYKPPSEVRGRHDNFGVKPKAEIDPESLYDDVEDASRVNLHNPSKPMPRSRFVSLCFLPEDILATNPEDLESFTPDYNLSALEVEEISATTRNDIALISSPKPSLILLLLESRASDHLACAVVTNDVLKSLPEVQPMPGFFILPITSTSADVPEFEPEDVFPHIKGLNNRNIIKCPRFKIRPSKFPSEIREAAQIRILRRKSNRS